MARHLAIDTPQTQEMVRQLITLTQLDIWRNLEELLDIWVSSSAHHPFSSTSDSAENRTAGRFSKRLIHIFLKLLQRLVKKIWNLI